MSPPSGRRTQSLEILNDDLSALRLQDDSGNGSGSLSRPSSAMDDKGRRGSSAVNTSSPSNRGGRRHAHFEDEEVKEKEEDQSPIGRGVSSPALSNLSSAQTTTTDLTFGYSALPK